MEAWYLAYAGVRSKAKNDEKSVTIIFNNSDVNARHGRSYDTQLTKSATMENRRRPWYSLMFLWPLFTPLPPPLRFPEMVTMENRRIASPQCLA
jgi:hypothetical protein